MQQTIEIHEFLQRVEQNEGLEMREKCAALVKELPEGVEFRSFAIRQRASELLTYEQRNASAALAAQPFDSRTDDQRKD